jgi:hypothetical protein
VLPDTRRLKFSTGQVPKKEKNTHAVIEFPQIMVEEMMEQRVT